MSRAREGYDRSQQLAGNIAGAGAGAVGAGAAILAPLELARRAAGDYESSLTDVAQKANLNRREAKALGAELLGVASAANQLPEDVVLATDALTGLGAELGQARDMIPAIARGATAYKASMEDLGRASYAAVDNLKVPAAQTGKVLDAMAEAGKRGAFEVRDMAQYFPSLTAASAGLGHTGVGAVADLAAALQITRKGAGDSAEAATNLGNLLQKISAPLTVKKFAKFGVDLEAELKAAAKRGESPIEAITNLTNKALGGDLSKLGYLFEDAQVQKALRPLIQNLEEYRSIRAGALGAEGVVDADFVERLKDQNEATKAASIGLRTLGLTIGAELAPTVTAVANLVADVAKRVNAWAQANPAVAGTLAKVAAVIGILLVVLGGVALAVAAILGPFALANLAFTSALPILSALGGGLGFAARAFGVAGKAALIMGRALMLNPIGLIVTAIAVAAFLVIRYWKPISAFFGRLWSGIQDVGGKALAWFRQIGPTVAAFALQAIGPVGLIIRHWSTISAFFGQVWGRVRALTDGAMAWFQGLGARFREFGANIIAGLIGGIVGRLGELRSTVTGVAGQAATWFKERLGIRSPSRLFAEFGGDTMAGLDRGLQRGQAGPLATVRNVATGLAAVMASGPAIAAPQLLPAPLPPSGAPVAAAAQQSMAGVMARLPEPERLAAAFRQDAERRPVVVPGSTSAPAQRSSPPAAPSPASSAPVTINIYPPPGSDEKAIAKAVAAELDKRDRLAAARRRSSLSDQSDT